MSQLARSVFLDPGRLARQRAQVVQLGAADAATADHLERREHRGVEREDALDFRMNEFFATCLREHDTVTVAWALGALRQQARHSFMYGPQTALYRDYPENQGDRVDLELDLICIMDGKFAIGEVKASSELIAKSDIEDLADSAKEVGADVAVLAAVRFCR